MAAVVRPPACTVILADIVGSRRLAGRRDAVQEQLRTALAALNATLSRPALLSPFEIREGDAIRAVVSVPSVIFHAWTAIDGVLGAGRVRYGIGFGSLETFRAFPDDADGPAYHHARDALAEATARSRRNVPPVVFRGFGREPGSGQGGDWDAALTACGVLLAELRRRRTPAQRRVIAHMRADLTQREIAERLAISPPAVTKHLQSAGWAAYRTAEDELQHRVFAGGRFDTRASWERFLAGRAP